MEIQNCRKCGRLFNYLAGLHYCPRCMKELDDKFHEVKKYIYDHPGVGVAEVSEVMEVSVTQIRQWVREERLQFAEGSVTDIACEKCGKQILSGRFCLLCKDEMVNNLKSAYHNPATYDNGNKDKNAKMRYLK